MNIFPSRADTRCLRPHQNKWLHNIKPLPQLDRLLLGFAFLRFNSDVTSCIFSLISKCRCTIRFVFLTESHKGGHQILPSFTVKTRRAKHQHTEVTTWGKATVNKPEPRETLWWFRHDGVVGDLCQGRNHSSEQCDWLRSGNYGMQWSRANQQQIQRMWCKYSGKMGQDLWQIWNHASW